MSIYPQNQYIPYTYLIGWSQLDRWYYGSEYGSKSKMANPNNLWNTYFTSSKHVQQFREQYGEPDVVQVRKTFKEEDSTRSWESKVLKRIKAPSDDKWLNKSDGTLNSLNSEERSRISKERMADPIIKDRILKTQKETMNTTEYKQKRSQIAKEMWNDSEFRNKRLLQMNTPESSKKNSEAQKKAQNNIETIKKKSQKAKQNWSDPNYRAKRKSQKEIQNRPEVILKKSEAVKSLWLNPDYRYKITESRKKDPIFYCECCDRHIKGISNWHSHLNGNKHKKFT